MNVEDAISYTRKYLPWYTTYDKTVEQALVYFLKRQEDIGEEVTEMSIKTWAQKLFN